MHIYIVHFVRVESDKMHNAFTARTFVVVRLITALNQCLNVSLCYLTKRSGYNSRIETMTLIHFT